MNAQETRLNNDIDALRFVHQFGWLRIAELGMLMKPHTNTSLEAGARLARNLAKRQLVLLRRLPDGAGQALVLASAGARLLAENGISAVTGKDLGKALNETWIPSLSWRHDILAHGVLCDLHRQGYQVIPETEIRRQAGATTKLPDGLVLAPGAESRWLILEVENARKSGPNMNRLAETVVRVANGEYEIVGKRPVGCLIAFWKDSRDERGYQLDHRHRVARAVASVSYGDVPLTLLECTRKGSVGVAAVETIQVTIKSSRASLVLDQLDANGWHEDGNALLVSKYEMNRAYVWPYSLKDGSWWYSAEGKGWSSPDGTASSLDEAKRMAAKLIAEHLRAKQKVSSRPGSPRSLGRSHPIGQAKNSAWDSR